MAKLNTREMFYNHQIAKLNTLKNIFFFESRNLIPLRYLKKWPCSSVSIVDFEQCLLGAH